MQGNARFVGFTSGCGGCGTTSAALAYGRSLSRLEGKNVLYISFDFLCSKCLGDGKASKKDLYNVIVAGEEPNVLRNEIVEDCFGLKYMSFSDIVNPLHLNSKDLDFLFTNLSINFDVVILDVPSNSIMNVEVLPYCEDIVVVYGYNNRVHKYCDDEFSYVTQLCLDSVPHKFYSDYDEESFLDDTVEIHGSFGAKVRELATQIGA